MHLKIHYRKKLYIYNYIVIFGFSTNLGVFYIYYYTHIIEVKLYTQTMVFRCLILLMERDHLAECIYNCTNIQIHNHGTRTHDVSTIEWGNRWLKADEIIIVKSKVKSGLFFYFSGFNVRVTHFLKVSKVRFMKRCHFLSFLNRTPKWVN